jgi:hypothetical protein
MKKTQTPRVQHLPLIFARCFSVRLVPKNRVSDGMKMNTNLMRSSRKDLAKNEGPPACFLDDIEPCVSGPAMLDDSHFLTMHRMAANRFYNFPGKIREPTGTQRQIKFLDLSAGKLFAQAKMREVIFGNHKAAAGLLVEPVYHAGPKRAANAAQIRYVM